MGNEIIPPLSELVPSEELGRYDWYGACQRAAELISDTVPAPYRSRTFSGIIGDIKVLPPRKALSLISRKKGLGRQYAYLYLTTGIDHGYGYQACASEALRQTLGNDLSNIVHGAVLDVGCAVGVTAGALGLSGVTGFDLFPDLLRAGQLVDDLTGTQNRYVAADMTEPWPFADNSFHSVTSGLVCHHLKEPAVVRSFFAEANRVLKPDGTLIITLPAGSVSRASHMDSLVSALRQYGFVTSPQFSGLVASTDRPHSLFWMFCIVARKIEPARNISFIHDQFGFPEFRTPISREHKAQKARKTAIASRRVRHSEFRLIQLDELATLFGENDMVFEKVHERINNRPEG